MSKMSDLHAASAPDRADAAELHARWLEYQMRFAALKCLELADRVVNRRGPPATRSEAAAVLRGLAAELAGEAGSSVEALTRRPR